MFCHGTQIMGNSRICHCLLFHEHGAKANFMQPFCLSRKLLRYTHTLGLNITMKSWAESLALMNVIMHGPYLKRMQLLCVIWRYRLWAACPCLSRFAVALSSAWSWFTAHELVLNIAIWNLFAQFKFSVYGQTQTYIHMRFALQSASVGLAQARPKYCFFKFVTWLCAEAITEPAILWCYKCFLNCGILNEQSIAEYLYETESCGGSRWML